jgi:hypothetical protein
MRTAPLWGLVTRDALLHDGRVDSGGFASRINDAVLFHGGEAVTSVMNYSALTAADRAALVSFLESLGRLEFDSNFDTGITYDDFVSLAGCFSGPGSVYSADDPCAVHDVDQDGDVDLADATLFFSVYTDPVPDCDSNLENDLLEILANPSLDCNGNFVLDSCDIAASTSLDASGNGVPDECETFWRGDCNHSGGLDISDVISQLSGLFGGGPQPLCDDACDVNDDGQLNVADAIFSLSYQFASGAPPPPPFSSCAVDGTVSDLLDCDSPLSCP